MTINIKQFAKEKHRALKYDGLEIQDCLNIHLLDKEKYSFIPEIDKFGQFDYLKVSLNFFLVKNKIVAQSDEIPYKLNDLLVVVSVPVAIPFLKGRLNILNEKSEYDYESIIKLIENNEVDELKKIKQSIKEKLQEYSFIYTEGKVVKFLQLTHYGFDTPNLNQQQVDKLYKITNNKLNELTNHTDLIKEIFSALLDDVSLSFLLNLDISDMPKNDNVQNFLKIFNGTEIIGSKRYEHISLNNDFQQMSEERFMSCVRKQFDMSWIMKKVNAEMKQTKGKNYYSNKKQALSEMEKSMYEMLNKKNMLHPNVEHNPIDDNEEETSETKNRLWEFVNPNMADTDIDNKEQL